MIFLNIVLVIEIIFVFAGLMFIHELGHFIFAKRAGILVREFSLGLGPKLFSFKKGETQYSVRILPFGAYVRMAGEDPEITDIKTGRTVGLKFNNAGLVSDIYLDKSTSDKKIKIDDFDFEHDLFVKGTVDEESQVVYKLSRETILHSDDKKRIQIAPWDRQFGSKTIKQKFATVLAGPVFNLILALVLFFTVALMLGAPANSVMINAVNSDSPAEVAGLQKGDIILGLDDISYETNEKLLVAIQDSPGSEINLRIERDGSILYVPVTPKEVEETGKGLIGIGVEYVWEDITVTQAVAAAFNRTVELTVMIFSGFGQIITGNVGLDDVAGPVGIMQITSKAAKEGLAILIDWAAILSLYLGIFNLLPIPALDGSRLLFLSIEGVRGKPIDPKRESMVHLIGFAFLMLLMVVVTINDVSRFFN